MATSLIQIQIDETLKTKATQIYSNLGLDISTAICMFLKQTVKENGIPFNIIFPNSQNYNAIEGLQALSEITEESDKNGLSEMTLDEINAEIESTRKEIKK